MELIPTELPGLQIIRPRIFRDERGSFVKTFQADQFRALGLDFEPREEFFSTSARGVRRGMHCRHASRRNGAGQKSGMRSRDFTRSNSSAAYSPVGWSRNSHGSLNFFDSSAASACTPKVSVA